MPTPNLPLTLVLKNEDLVKRIRENSWENAKHHRRRKSESVLDSKQDTTILGS